MAGGALVVEEFCSALQCGVGALWGKRVGMGWGVWGVWGEGGWVEGSQSCAWSRQPCREVLLPVAMLAGPRVSQYLQGPWTNDLDGCS